MPDQKVLLEIPTVEGALESSSEGASGPRKLKPVDRNQLLMMTLDVDWLVPADHKVRAIWELTGKLNRRGFPTGIRSEVGRAGREHNDPRLLVAIWLYACSESISSAREVSRQMEHEPGLRWLAGMEVINHTTLPDFRTAHRVALDEVFTELLAVLEWEQIHKTKRGR